MHFICRLIAEQSLLIYDVAGETRVNKINTRVHFIVGLKMKERKAGLSPILAATINIQAQSMFPGEIKKGYKSL